VEKAEALPLATASNANPSFIVLIASFLILAPTSDNDNTIARVLTTTTT
jgi:hypothetical protein